MPRTDAPEPADDDRDDPDDAVDDLDDDEAGAVDAAAARFAVDPRPHMPRVLPTMLPGPVSFATSFGRDMPLEVELGFGRPHFLLERAREVPDHGVVGIEWKGRWPRAVWQKQKRGEAQNVRALHGNAWQLFGGLFAPSSVRAVYLNFPDPWWKTKHQKRRIISDAFARLIASRLVPGGTVLVQTDVATLLEEILANLESEPSLHNQNGPGRLAPRKPVQASSHREKKCRADGVPIFRGVVEKR